MIIPWIVGIVGALVALSAFVWADWGDKCFSFFFSAVGTAMAVILSLLLTGAIGYFTIDLAPYRQTYRFGVLAANDSTNMSGRFGIFSGYTNEEWRYFFYREYANGGIRMGSIDEDRTVVYQDAELDPYVIVFEQETIKRWYGWRQGGYKKYELHVPRGTVIEETRLDLEK